MAAKAASTRSPVIRTCGNGSVSRACSHIRVSSRPSSELAETPHGELGETRLVRRARSALDDGARLVGARRGEKQGDVPAHVQKAHRQRDLVASDVWESSPVPAREDELERSVDARTEVEPAREPLCDLAHRGERRARPRTGLGDGVLDECGADFRRPPRSDVCAIEREHFRGVGRVDQEERGSVRDVVAEELRGLVPVRRAPGGVEERDVVRIHQLLRRCSGELAEPSREHGAPQRVLERLTGAEVGRERKRTHHLGGADRLLTCWILRGHVRIL